MDVQLINWYRVIGNKRKQLSPGKKYEILRKGDYVFLVVKAATKADRGEIYLYNYLEYSNLV